MLLPCLSHACHVCVHLLQLSLKSELEAGWALRAGQQATALKEAQAKVAALEKSLQQVCTAMGHGCDNNPKCKPTNFVCVM
jgi:hypothetical protein